MVNFTLFFLEKKIDETQNQNFNVICRLFLLFNELKDIYNSNKMSEIFFGSLNSS